MDRIAQAIFRLEVSTHMTIYFNSYITNLDKWLKYTYTYTPSQYFFFVKIKFSYAFSNPILKITQLVSLCIYCESGWDGWRLVSVDEMG